MFSVQILWFQVAFIRFLPLFIILILFLVNLLYEVPFFFSCIHLLVFQAATTFSINILWFQRFSLDYYCRLIMYYFRIIIFVQGRPLVFYSFVPFLGHPYVFCSYFCDPMCGFHWIITFVYLFFYFSVQVRPLLLFYLIISKWYL